MAAKKTTKNIRSAQRLSFAKTREPIELPNLLTLQTESFEWLVGAKPWRDKVGADAKTGLQEIFEELSPIEDNPNNPSEAKMGLEFKDPTLDEPNVTPDECKVKGKTYARPL